MARNGYKVTVYLDDNPNSITYMQTYEERVEDTEKCPISSDDLILISSECEIGISGGYTGYRLLQYYNRTTHEYVYVREQDAECEESSTEEEWVNSGSPYCETTEQGLNTGYMLQLQVQMNRILPNYGQTRYQKYKSPECGGNNCPQWELVSKQCHISVANCVATFDGTADNVEIDVNPLSESYNQTRTVNKQDSDCENCTTSLFSWVLVGDMCGDDSLLCDNGIQETSTNSYTVHRKYKTIGGASPIPMDEYQVVLKIEDDEDCGYIRPQYEMRRINGQYICDFETYTKYEKWCQYVSYDSGVTWSYVVPEVCERGAVIAYDSYDCGKPMYRWIPNGEFTCVDNGDDGKIVYWNSDGVMVSAYTCDETNYINRTHVSGMTQVVSGITSPDGYKDCYQVGDCVSVINGFGLTAKVWLGNYTEKINDGLQNYERNSLDIPSNVNYIGSVFNNSTSHWNPALRTMVLHPLTPPTLSGTTSMPIPMRYPQSYKDAGIFVPYEAYDDYLEAWSTYSSIIKQMNNDTDSFKAIIGYKSDFTSWKCYVPDGESASTIAQNEWIYGRPNITSITLTNKVITVADNAFCKADSYSGMYKLKELNLGSTVETIGTNAFKAGSSTVFDAQLDHMTLPSSLKLVKDSAFPSNIDKLYVNCTAEWQGQGIAANKVYVPNLNVLSNNTFSGLSSSFLSKSSSQLYINNELITDLVIPSGTSVGKYTFGLINFNSVTIEEGASVAGSAFGGSINDLYLNTLAFISKVSRVHVPCGKLVDYNYWYSSPTRLVVEQDQCTDSPFKNMALSGVTNYGYYGDEDDYYIFSVAGDPKGNSRFGKVTFTITGKTLSLYYQISRPRYSNAKVTVMYNDTLLCGWNTDTSGDFIYYSKNFDEVLSDGENTITVDLYGYGDGIAYIGVPLNTSSQKRVIARLYQDDGTIVNVERASNIQVVKLKWADVEPYSSTTSSITIYDCDGINGGFNFDGMEKLQTLEFVTPNPPSISTYQTSASTKPYKIIVPCDGFFAYYEALDECKRLIPSDNSCYEESWVHESNICDYVTHYFTDIYRKYLTIDSITIPTDITSSVTTSNVCVEVEIGDFNLSQDGKTYNSQTGSVESTMYITFYGSDRNVRIQVPKNQQTGNNYGEIDIYRTDTGSFVDYTRYSKDLTLSSGIRYKIYFEGQFTNDVYAQFIMLS